MNSQNAVLRSSSAADSQGGLLRSRSAAVRVRPLALIPERLVPLGGHVRAGRSLHLIDLENLAGGPAAIPQVGRRVASQYRRLAGVAADDHIVIGAHPMSLFEARTLFPRGRLVGYRGPDGADRALLAELADPLWVATHYDRVVIGSGDHAFAAAAGELLDLGVLVGVVARRHGIASALLRAARFTRFITEFGSTERSVA